MQDETCDLTMRGKHESVCSRLYQLGIQSFKVCLAICILVTGLSVAISWSRIMRASNETPVTVSRPISADQYPLVCMFTSFKSDIAKLPVNNVYCWNDTVSKWP